MLKKSKLLRPLPGQLPFGRIAKISPWGVFEELRNVLLLQEEGTHGLSVFTQEEQGRYRITTTNTREGIYLKW
jgi:hypothetical protein